MNYDDLYGKDFSLEEVAAKTKQTRERIRQIREKGLRSLRKKANSHLLKNYL